MPIKIVPEEIARPTPWQKYLLYFLIFLVLVSILGYFILDYYFIKKANQKLQGVKTKITEAKSPQRIALEDKIKNYREKIKDFSSLLLNHKKSSNFFNFLEGITHPKVFFSDVNLNIAGNQVEVSGQAESFRVLAEQLLIFRANTEIIRAFRLSKLKFGKEGKIEFTFNISLNPNLFK